MGKTTLIRAAVAAGGSRPHEGGALATLSWSAYLPLRRAMGGAVATTVWDGDPEFVAAAVEERLGDGVLVLDDLQWADAATLAAVPFLAGRIRLLAAVRRGDPSTDAALAVLNDNGFEIIELEPLEHDDSVALARGILSRGTGRGLDTPAAEATVARAGGNPLLIEELAAGDPGAKSLRLAMAARMRDLPPDAVEGLELLALARQPLPEARVPGAGALRSAGLTVSDRAGLTLRHALLAEVVVDGLGQARRIDLHRALARLLTHPGDVARQHLHAGDHAAGYAAAMTAVESATTPGERSAHLITAANCASATAEPGLMLRAARAAVEAGAWAEAESILAGIPDEDELQARAAMIRARACSEAGDYAGWDRWVAEGLARNGGGGTDIEVELLAERAKIVLFTQQDLPAALDLAQQAVRRADELRMHRGRAYYMRGTVEYYQGDPSWQEDLSLACELARIENDLSTEFVAANNLIVAHEGAGDPVQGASIAEQMMARADDLKLLRWRRHFWSARLNLAMHAGDYQLVIDSAPQLLAAPVMRRTREEITSAWALSLVDIGRIDEGLRVGEGALRDSTLHHSNLYHLRAVAHELAGRPESALAELDGFLDSSESGHRVALAAPTFHWAAWSAGVPAPALPDLAEAVEVAMLHAVPHELEGIEALRGQDAERAAECFRTAAGLWRVYHRRGEVRCLWAAGFALAQAGRESQAVEHLLKAEQVAKDHQMAPMLARIAKGLRGLGVRRSAPRSAGRGGRLTERELDALILAGQGLSDASIAARLGLSPRTVESQIASARRKLGASNRRQAATLATSADAS